MDKIEDPNDKSRADKGCGKFSHPYEPYQIQLDFMNELNNVLDAAQIGIFESPTGTGKTLSIICAALTWLRQNLALDLDSQAHDEDTNEPAWLRETEISQTEVQLRGSLNSLLGRLSKFRLNGNIANIQPNRGYKKLRPSPIGGDMHNEDEFVLSSDEEDTTANHRNRDNDKAGMFSDEVKKLLEAANHPAVAQSVAEDEELPRMRKIYFCSRTHSQLNQFASELHKPRFAGLTLDYEPPRYVALASRKNLCINSEVARLPLEQLNDACLQLQDKKTPQAGRCKFLEKDPTRNKLFSDHVLSRIKDIEDLTELGGALGMCPYYGVRNALSSSEIIAMPYPLLLNRTARESLGIDLTGHVVIIDEAHNLIDAITDLSSAAILSEDVQRAQKQLQVYLERYANRLSGRNKMYVEQIRRLCAGMEMFFQTSPKSGQVTFAQLLPKGSDSINTRNLLKYLRSSKLARKVEAYNQSHQSELGSSDSQGLNRVQRFLECMDNPAQEGRLLVQERDDGRMALQYMLLDPAHEFEDIVKDARSIVLAGGTMQPVEDIVSLLFAAERDRVRTFSCGHIIPKDNLIALTIVAGPMKLPLEFTLQKRHNAAMLTDLGSLLINLIGIIPDGIVVFFTSYKYLEHVINFWKEAGQLQRLEAKKPIFLESKNNAVEDILSAYSQAIHQGRGGLLLAVMGGKMSEGINFSDDLGRAVCVVGVPYPNIHTPEWQLRLEFVRQKALQTCLADGLDNASAIAHANIAASEHFENAAMRAVNQSIGRAIRHKDDYAMIYLIDTRYDKINLKSKLPGWILDNLKTNKNAEFGNVVRDTSLFFKRRKARF